MNRDKIGIYLKDARWMLRLRPEGPPMTTERDE